MKAWVGLGVWGKYLNMLCRYLENESVDHLPVPFMASTRKGMPLSRYLRVTGIRMLWAIMFGGTAGIFQGLSQAIWKPSASASITSAGFVAEKEIFCARF